MEGAPDVLADNDEQIFSEVRMNDQEPDYIKEVENVEYTVQENLPEIEAIEASPMDGGILDMPKEHGIADLVRKCMKHHSVFIAVVLCCHIVVTIFSIAVVPFYVTLIRIITSVVGFFALNVITPIAALYSLIGVFFEDWSSGIKFFVIVLLLFLFTCISCLEMCGMVKTIMLLITRRKIRLEEKLEEEEARRRSMEIEQQQDNLPMVEDPVIPVSMSVQEDNNSGSIMVEQSRRSHSLQHTSISQDQVIYGNIEPEVSAQIHPQDGSGEMVLQSYGVQPVTTEEPTY